MDIKSAKKIYSKLKLVFWVYKNIIWHPREQLITEDTAQACDLRKFLKTYTLGPML
jgi:hypothetical protein